jgi:hypothetical protein
MKKFLLIVFLLCVTAYAYADQRQGKVYFDGPDKLVVATGGTLEVAGVEITADTLAMDDLTASAAELNQLDNLSNPVASTTASKKIVGGSASVSAGDDTANTKTIATGITVVTAIVQVIRSGKVVSSDAAVSFSAGNLVVADGSSYVLTSGDTINWVAFGS